MRSALPGIPQSANWVATFFTSNSTRRCLTSQPPLRSVNHDDVFCLQKAPLVLPVEGAPLVFSAAIAHDFVLQMPDKNGNTLKFPAKAAPASGGFVVDTHIGRLARRFGWTTNEDPVKVEQDLMRRVPRQDWLDLSHLMIFHGRAICQARKPLCQRCSLSKLCPSAFRIVQ